MKVQGTIALSSPREGSSTTEVQVWCGQREDLATWASTIKPKLWTDQPCPTVVGRGSGQEGTTSTKRLFIYFISKLSF